MSNPRVFTDISIISDTWYVPPECAFYTRLVSLALYNRFFLVRLLKMGSSWDYIPAFLALGIFGGRALPQEHLYYRFALGAFHRFDGDIFPGLLTAFQNCHSRILLPALQPPSSYYLTSFIIALS